MMSIPGHCLILPAGLVLATFLSGQNPVAATAASETAPSEQPAAPVAGSRPGTFRYNVTFARRGFTLDAFGAAIRSGKTHDEVTLIVRDLELRAREEYAPARAAVLALGGFVVTEFWLINAITVEIAPDQVEALAGLAGVLHVRPDLPAYPVGLVPILTATNANNHNADGVQALGYKGTGFSMAIIDSGQDSDMGGLGRPHMGYFRNANVSDRSGGGIGGSLLLANKALPGTIGADDTLGHGTAVASVAGGAGWNNAGADRGHAYDAGKVGYSICAAQGCPSTFSILALGWQSAAADRALYNIVVGNLSYSGSPDPTDISQQALDAAALFADILPVTAGGNTYGSSSTSSSSANGLAVAAVSPNSKSVAGFSSRGPLYGDTTRFYPDLSACGVATFMAARDNEAGVYAASGTSFASPQVSGAATLLKSIRPGSSARELKAMLLCNTEDVSAANAGLDRNAFGMGFLRDDLCVASALVPGTVLSSKLASTTTPSTWLLSVTNGQRVSVVLTWYRTVLGSYGWSDLNLKVWNGTTLLAASSDARNLYEKVTFTAPFTGVVTVEVAAAALDVPSCEYSLASTHPFIAGVPARYALFGSACVGSAGTPGLSVSGNPTLGKAFTLKLSFARPGSSAFCLLGVSNTFWGPLALPFDLGSLAWAPGCFVLASGEVVAAAPTTASGQAAVTFPIPNDPALRGMTFYNQFAMLDAGVNPLGLVVSEGGRGTFGDF